MNDYQNYQDVKSYTEELLSVTEFRDHRERLRYQERLGQVRQHLVKWNKKLDGASKSKDSAEVARRAEAGQLIRSVNFRLLRLSV